MITNEVLKFYTELSENNNKDWFIQNKTRYQKVKQTLDNFATELITATASFDPKIADLSPKDCQFRIYRDVRFSHDKTPYKTNAGIFLVPGGKKSGNAGYYVHFQPGNSFLGGGIHMPPSNILKAIRTEIYNFPEDFIPIINDKAFKNAFGELDGNKLVNPPKGFDKEFEHIDLLKFKSYTVGHPISDEVLMDDKNGLNAIMKSFKTMKPFLDFLSRAVRENL